MHRDGGGARSARNEDIETLVKNAVLSSAMGERLPAERQEKLWVVRKTDARGLRAAAHALLALRRRLSGLRRG